MPAVSSTQNGLGDTFALISTTFSRHEFCKGIGKTMSTNDNSDIPRTKQILRALIDFGFSGFNKDSLINRVLAQKECASDDDRKEERGQISRAIRNLIDNGKIEDTYRLSPHSSALDIGERSGVMVRLLRSGQIHDTIIDLLCAYRDYIGQCRAQDDEGNVAGPPQSKLRDIFGADSQFSEAFNIYNRTGIEPVVLIDMEVIHSLPGESDLLVHFQHRNARSLFSYVRDFILPIEGVESSHTFHVDVSLHRSQAMWEEIETRMKKRMSNNDASASIQKERGNT